MSRPAPHPPGGLFVGTVVQPYDSSRPRGSRYGQGQIPGMRPPRLPAAETSATPIYDSLYAEYSRLFRALPGDRSGEEALAFEGFGTVHGTGLWDALDLRESDGKLPALPPSPRDGQGYGPR